MRRAQGWRRAVLAALAGAAFTLVGGLSAPAWAQQRQLGPDPVEVWEGPMNYAATAASLLSCQPGSCADGGAGIQGDTCQGLNRSTAPLDTLPDLPGLRVVHARLSWIATTAANAMPDAEVTLVPPGGAPIPAALDPAISQSYVDGLSPQECQFVAISCPGVECDLGFYAANADVTEALNAHLAGGGSLNGDWTLQDVSIAGTDPNDPGTALAGAVSITMGAWSLLIVYEHDQLPLRRIYYYQGFEELAGENRTVRPRGFRAPPDPTVDVTYLVLEGDEGIQGDSLEINGQQLQNDCNPRRNVFNSTVNGNRADGSCQRGVQSVDLDSFRVVDALEPGDESADVTFIVPRGDGFITPGEQIFSAWLVLAFDHVPPNFVSVKPEKSAEPPHGSAVAPGGVIEYFIQIENNGGDFAANVTVTDAAPAGTAYVPGSTVVDQRPVADLPGGRSPLAGGLNLQSLPEIDLIGPGERHLVRFQVRVDDEAADGDAIRNIAQIGADGIAPADSDEVVHFVGEVPDGGIPPRPDMGLDASTPPPPRDAGTPPPPRDAAPPLTDAGCLAGERRTVTGECVPIACPDGAMLVGAECVAPDASICGPGQTFQDGRCQAICGDGLRWDPTCNQCRYQGDPPCDGAPAASGGNSDDCGCRMDGDAPPPALLLLLLPLLLRRRRA
ncbi:MAG: DUF11 domain-containing protein [Myxococcales bacterium]|nr:DUF11 domain-containing protein [Myxococcales bacterium]